MNPNKRIWEELKRIHPTVYTALESQKNTLFPKHVTELDPANIATKLALLHELNTQHKTNIPLKGLTGNFHYSLKRVEDTIMTKIRKLKDSKLIAPPSKQATPLATFIPTTRQKTIILQPEPLGYKATAWRKRGTKPLAIIGENLLKQDKPTAPKPTKHAKVKWKPVHLVELDTKTGRGGEYASDFAKMVRKIGRSMVTKQHFEHLQKQIPRIQQELEQQGRPLSEEETSIFKKIIDGMIAADDITPTTDKKETLLSSGVPQETLNTIQRKISQSLTFQRLKRNFAREYDAMLRKIEGTE